jgi:hypothetical protein
MYSKHTCCYHLRCSLHVGFGGDLLLHFYEEVSLTAENRPHDALESCKVQIARYTVDTQRKVLIVEVINGRQLSVGVYRVVYPPRRS